MTASSDRLEYMADFFCIVALSIQIQSNTATEKIRNIALIGIAIYNKKNIQRMNDNVLDIIIVLINTKSISQRERTVRANEFYFW